ncbi:hypothetical protein EJ06DRAFT_192585 [Trichodelitschia bisporula]|uniref:Uncharacterized protein n=1 Tax=Trichodelitschia bisporula TaxID=703511 RepID=A0A6G1I7S6_9PEZI|nr:hypothetical protein EJ06DRAFT_192585 [Trichodelitschia bisporula]
MGPKAAKFGADLPPDLVWPKEIELGLGPCRVVNDMDGVVCSCIRGYSSVRLSTSTSTTHLRRRCDHCQHLMVWHRERTADEKTAEPFYPGKRSHDAMAAGETSPDDQEAKRVCTDGVTGNAEDAGPTTDDNCNANLTVDGVDQANAGAPSGTSTDSLNFSTSAVCDSQTDATPIPSPSHDTSATEG